MNVSNRKKQRGQRRKLKVLLKEIDEITPLHDTSFAYDHFHVPGGLFIDHPKTNGKIKTAFCRKWIQKAEEILAQKPKELPFCKVVAVIDTPYFSNSQIIIFYDKEYYDMFWERTGPEQIWKHIDDKNVSFVKERNIATNLLEKGYVETICENGRCKHPCFCKSFIYCEKQEKI